MGTQEGVTAAFVISIMVGIGILAFWTKLKKGVNANKQAPLTQSISSAPVPPAHGFSTYATSSPKKGCGCGH